MTTAIIVQARMASTRLPDKVMLELAGRTVLAHVLERCKAVKGADAVCCATTVSPADDAIADEAGRCGVEVFRGSEQDVLERYHQAARMLEATTVLRVTSDCPLLDPEVCESVIQLRERTNADYATNNLAATFPHGVDCEAFTFKWLERAAKEATSPFDREHVTHYILQHPEVHIEDLTGPGEKAARHRWVLDTGADLIFLQELFSRLPDGLGWGYRDLMDFIESSPALAAASVDPLREREAGITRYAEKPEEERAT